jgi:broad specificity phosphatase PhoE
MHDATIEADERWAETDFGLAEGLTFDELARVAPDIAARLAQGAVAIDWPGGESAASLAARVEAAWTDLNERVTPTLVVSHAGPLRIAIALATGRPVADVTAPEPGSVWEDADDRDGSAHGGRW